jgi:hypothetical protein
MTLKVRISIYEYKADINIQFIAFLLCPSPKSISLYMQNTFIPFQKAQNMRPDPMSTEESEV